MRDVVVSMQSTAPDSYSKQADIHRSMQPYHLIPGHLSWSAIKWPIGVSANGKTATGDRCHVGIVKANRQIVQRNERMLHSIHRKTIIFPFITSQLDGNRMLSLWHSLRWITNNFVAVIAAVSPQAVLHAEEEGSGDVGDCQPLWPPHRMELGSPHPEGQTPQEPAVWVNSETCTRVTPKTTAASSLARQSIRYYHKKYGFSRGQIL